MPISYNQEEMRTIDEEAGVSLFQFTQHREHLYFLLSIDGKKFMISTLFFSKELPGANDDSRIHTLNVYGFSHVDEKDITRTYNKDLDIWVYSHLGQYVKANHESYKSVIESHLKILMRFGHSESEWPHASVIDFSKLDESRKVQGIT